jgi:hypothetical protein
MSPIRAIKDRFLKFATELRFPKLLALTAGLFLFDLIVPDFIPLIDEILLGLGAALLASLKRNRREPVEAEIAPPRVE